MSCRKYLKILFLRHNKHWKIPRHSEVQFRETAVVDVTEYVNKFPVSHETHKMYTNNFGHKTGLYIIKGLRKISTSKIRV
jgi:hypothetical protein